MRLSHRFLLGTCAALLLGGLLAGAGGAEAQGGGRLPGLDGGALTQADLTQKDTVLVFWASWSPKCRNIAQRVNQIHSAWNGTARVVTVNFQEDESTIREFLGGQRLRAPVYLDRDGKFSRRHTVTDLPGLVVYKAGSVVYQGRLPQDVDKLLERVLG